MAMAELANFLGWCTLLNLGMLVLTTIVLVAGHTSIARIHSRWFNLPPSEVSTLYFNYLANYKILILVFNLMPYLALRIMGVS